MTWARYVFTLSHLSYVVHNSGVFTPTLNSIVVVTPAVIFWFNNLDSPTLVLSHLLYMQALTSFIVMSFSVMFSTSNFMLVVTVPSFSVARLGVVIVMSSLPISDTFTPYT